MRPNTYVGVGPRWEKCIALNLEGATLAQAGDVTAAAANFEAAYQETLVSQDVEALVCRAAVAGNLAGLAATVGDGAQALRWSTEGIELGRAIVEQVGDTYGTVAVLVNGLVSRAQLYRHASRFDEALADLDEASVAEDSAPLRAVRASILAGAGRFDEATAEAQVALNLAYETAPYLAPSVHTTLAEIAGSTGDPAGSAEQFGLARELSAAMGDKAGEATALLSLARLAYLSSDNDRAEAFYNQADELLRATGDRRRLAVSLHGRAAMEISRGRPRDSLRLLDQVLLALGAEVTPTERIAVLQVQGGAWETLGEYAKADECYGVATSVSVQAGLWHVALGIAWWHADSLVRWASTVDGGQRRQLSHRALDLALPAALAAEAVRQRFAHGPLRERWVSLAAAPATRAAFDAIGAVGDVELAAAYIDHIAGAVSLHAEQDTPVTREELLTLPSPPLADAEPVLGFALPPRVRVDLAVPSALDAWLDVAEQRYGFPVRSAQVVASW